MFHALQDLDARLKQLEQLYAKGTLAPAATGDGSGLPPVGAQGADPAAPVNLSTSKSQAQHSPWDLLPPHAAHITAAGVSLGAGQLPAPTTGGIGAASRGRAAAQDEGPAWALETKTYFQERDAALAQAAALATSYPAGPADYAPGGAPAAQERRLLKTSVAVLSSLYTPAGGGGVGAKPPKLKGQYDGGCGIHAACICGLISYLRR